MWFACLSFPPCLSTTPCAHLASISNFPRMCLSSNSRTSCIIEFQYLYFSPSLRTTSCVHLVSISKLPPRCPSATSCIHLVPISNLPPRCPLATSCIHVVSISKLPPSSQQLLALFLLRRCLTSPSHLPVSHQFSALIWFQYLTSPPCTSHQIPELRASLSFNIFACPLASPQLLAFILFQYLNFLPGAPQQLPAFILFQYLTFLPGAPRQLPAFMWFQYLSFPPRLSNFLRSSCFDDV